VLLICSPRNFNRYSYWTAGRCACNTLISLLFLLWT
jgi:hypothetical protein